MQDTLHTLRTEAEARMRAAASLDELDQARAAYLGRKGALKSAMRGLAQLTPEERPGAGQLANEVKQAVLAVLAERKAAIEGAESKAPPAPAIDISLPGVHRRIGRDLLKAF